MKRLFTVLIVTLIILGASFPGVAVRTAQAQTAITWTSTFYDNINFAGAPQLTLTDTDINENWVNGPPAVGLPADNFGVRWSSTPVLAGGVYEVSAFVDDGVRVLVDGAPVIDELHAAPGALYTATFSATAGQHTLVVEYIDLGGAAYIQFNLDLINATQPDTTPPGAAQTTATVLAYFLNVRTAPSVANGDVIDIISRNQTFPVVGRNAAGTWWLLDLGGATGWVSGAWIDVVNPAPVPVVDDVQSPVATATATVTAYVLNVRDAPSVVNGTVITQILRGQTYPVVGQNFDGTWWLIEVEGLTGWVSAAWVTVNNAQVVPVTS